jgi:hypothetical protein
MARVTAAVVVSVLLLVGAAQLGWAKSGQGTGPPLEQTASASAIGPETTASATATCPPGTRATGGGFRAPSSVDAVALVYESVKVRQRAWRASVQLLDIGAPSSLTITTYVYCRAQYPHTTTETSTVPTSGQTEVGPTASASCPRGQLAVGGGFRMPPPLSGPTVRSLYFDSLRSGTSAWNTKVVTGPAGVSSVTGEVYCARRIASPAEASGTSAPNSRDFTTSTASAACAAPSTPLAGGFSQPDSDVNSFLFVDESRRVDNGWQVSGLHSGTVPAVSLNAFAYCG